MPPDRPPSTRRELLLQAYYRLPSGHRWQIIAASLALGVVLALPLGALILFHEGPWTGLAWDLLVRLPFALLMVYCLVAALRSARGGRWKDAAMLVPIALLPAMVWVPIVRQGVGLLQLHRIAGDQVRAVTVACHATQDPVAIGEITTDLRAAEWYSPDSHGWTPYVDVTLTYADGHVERVALTRVLAEGRLVLRLGGGNAGLAAVPHLAVPLERAGLARVAALPRQIAPGSYEAIVPASVCR
ncbi:MAG TPA: hypothetical protein VEU55_09550 [Gemmatimonadales bacterium]|nr:hypothetical protein [Gemmatimonadales bacterium]